jgi:hypothetical protein
MASTGLAGVATEGATAGPPVIPETKPETNRIGYRTEYRHKITNQLLDQRVSDAPENDFLQVDSISAIFDIIKTYRVHPRDGTDGSGPDPLIIASEPSYSVKINSPAIMNAMRSVVKYYPSQDLSDGAIIEEPYAVVAHHFSELEIYANERAHSTSDDACVLDKVVTSHLRALLEFVDKSVMEGFRAEKERNARGFYTYKYLWVSRRPGYTILFRSRGAKHWEAGVIMSTAGGPFTDPPSQWTTEYWNLRYNGTYLVRTSGLMYTSISDGEASFEQHSTIILPGQEIGNAQNPVIEKLIRNGRMYCRLIEKQCMYHRGENILPPIQMVVRSFFICIFVAWLMGRRLTGS